MLLLNLALAIIPSLIILLWAYRRDTAKAEPAWLVLVAFGLGVVAVVAAVGVGLALSPLQRYFGGIWRLVFRAFFTAGFLEELAKLSVVLLMVVKRKEFDEVADGMVYTMAASLGFAAVENVLYLGETSVLLVRGLTSVPLHAAAGGIMGYFVGVSRIEGRGSSAIGLLAAVILHGTYDLFLFVGDEWALVTIPLIIGAVVIVARLFREAVRMDQRAGRVDASPPGDSEVPPLGR